MFTLTPEQYSPVLTSNGTTWFDYDGDGGTTIRFGDGTFGMTPLPGTVFSVLYRVGGGSAGNVPADAIVNVAPGQAQGSMISSLHQPLPRHGRRGRRDHRADPRPGAAEVQRGAASGRAGRRLRGGSAVAARGCSRRPTSFRWTGSWLTVLTRADPAGTEEPTIAELQSLTELLDEERLAGYESYVLPPGYVSIDLRITVSARRGYFGSTVAAAVLARLQPGTLPGGAVGFFDHSRWSFGEPLESSALLAAIQSCPGVDGVDQVQYRERGGPAGLGAAAREAQGRPRRDPASRQRPEQA